MSIVFHEKSREFHLYNDQISYVIGILRNGQPGQLYYGKKLRDRESFAHLQKYGGGAMSVNPIKGDPFFTLELVRQEYPCFGTSDFRQPAFELLQENGSHISHMVYEGHRILAGKPEMAHLPHAYVETEGEADTLELTLRDALTGARIVLSYTIFRDLAAIARSARFENDGQETLRLTRAMSVSVDFPDAAFDWMQFSGAWCRERAPHVRPLEMGLTAIESMRGHSSPHQNPFIILKRRNTTEREGQAYGFSFVYSGNFLAQAEVDSYGTTRFTMGINPREFCWKLQPGESFQTPEVLMTWSDGGLNGLSGQIHTLLRHHVARGPWRDQPRPILLNNWEATGMEFTQEEILRIARKGAEVGVELFVLDDGWFGHRTEFSGLGDWFPDRSKLPEGVPGLAKAITDLGLKFGIWIEPEMVSEDSLLYREHPEYVLASPGRSRSLGRNQMVLDFANPEVVDTVFAMLEKAFGDAPISYIKWDMNRSISECWSAALPADRQGETYHRYILGMYHLYEKLLDRYPQLLIESCASGGGRFDAGMLYYAPQAWCSDDSDGVERIRIQYGTSYGYPVSSWGAHVSECPNQQVGRQVPLRTRAAAAYFGAFGYEMDLNQMTEEEIAEVKAQVAFMKQYRSLIQYGRFYRLLDPYQGDFGAWMVVSEDKRQAIVALFQIMNRINTGYIQLKLEGLDPALDYEIEGRGIYGGDELMAFGLQPSDMASHVVQRAVDSGALELVRDFDSKLYILNAIG